MELDTNCRVSDYQGMCNCNVWPEHDLSQVDDEYGSPYIFCCMCYKVWSLDWTLLENPYGL